jgi:flagellar hook-basal body complex protein FliE
MSAIPLLSAPYRSPEEIPLLEAPARPQSLGEPLAQRSVAPAFAQVLDGFLQHVDTAQHRADAMVESLALGEPVDVHQVMLALNEASNAVQLTLQVRGKVLEAYQDLMRMPL